MTSDQKEKCHIIIHAAAASASGVAAGLAQLPVADHILITPIQITMVVALGKVFDKQIDETAAKGFVLGMAAQFVGRAASQIMFGWIPGLGNALNAATAAGLTESIGWAMAKRFGEATA